MSLIKRNGFLNLNPLFTDLFDVDNLFNTDFMRNDMVPAVNVKENANNFEIEVAAPGLTKEDFKITLENRILTISSEKRAEKNEENEKFTRKEFSYRAFKRSFSLPENVNEENVNANYENGILRLILTKKEIAKMAPRKEISIA